MNAYNELKLNLKDLSLIKCASLCGQLDYDTEKPEWEYNLNLGYDENDLNNFIENIKKIDYNSGYGGQELFGIVWLKDGTWLERGEYDGSEWWEHKVCPIIPESLY